LRDYGFKESWRHIVTQANGDIVHIVVDKDASGTVLSCFASGKSTVLLGCGQPGVERHHFQGVARAVVVGQRIGGIPDLPLAAEEDENVAWPFGAQFVDGVEGGLHLVARLVSTIVRVGDRPVAHLDRVRAAGHLDHRRIPALLA